MLMFENIITHYMNFKISVNIQSDNILYILILIRYL